MVKSIIQKLNIKIIVIIGLFVRLLSWPWIYHGDVTYTYWWGKFAAEFTWKGYYDWLNFGGYAHPDQPMLNIIYNWLIRLLYNFIYQILWYINVKIPAFPSKLMTWYFLHGNQALLKLPMIIADILIIYFVYRFIVKNFSPSKAKVAALILAFYPPLIYNSAVWGSGDSLINLFGLLAIYSLYQKKYIKFTLLFLVSILYKSSLIIWIPVIFIILLRQKVKIFSIIKMGLVSLIFVYVVSQPFAIKNSFIWFYEIFAQKILPGPMPQITANAMNFWALIFGLEPRLDELLLLNVISIRHLSLLICLFLSIYILKYLYLHYSTKILLLSLVQISMVVFTFMTRMHERYTFPALIPLFILCYYDKKYRKYFILLSITHCLNIYNWWWVPSVPPLISLLKTNFIIRLISLFNTVITLKLVSQNENKS